MSGEGPGEEVESAGGSWQITPGGQELPEAVAVTRPSDGDQETALLRRIEALEPDAGPDMLGAVFELACFYERTGQQRRATESLERLAERAEQPEIRARAFLHLGQLMEQVGEFAAADDAYARGLDAGPESPFCSYFLHNNRGFCCNELGDHVEAVALCTAAIETDPDRHNAYKNLGIALEAMGLLPRAAWAYVAATRRRPADPRALHRLEAMAEEHPELLADEELAERIERCRETYRVLRSEVG